MKAKEDCPYSYSLPEGEYGVCPIKDQFVNKVKANNQTVKVLKARIKDLEDEAEWWQIEVARVVALLAEHGVPFNVESKR